jgi:glycosyltransferase involved in cell wall biosynthesis
MKLTVLSVAYPLAPVGPDAVGGAEQVLTMLDSALTRAGHQSIVIACEGSVTDGLLLAVPRAAGELTDEVRRSVQRQHSAAIERALNQWPIDLVHMHGIDFDRYLPPSGAPVLVTLHLPPGWYSPEIFRLPRPRTYLHCVSAAQRRACPPGAVLLPDLENGVPVDRLATRVGKRDFVITIGRICPEKGFHIALDAAARAGRPMLLAGEVFRYAAHERYFQQEIVPRLDDSRRFIGPIGFERKRRLLSAARCLLAPSLAPETSSLVAMEALACGTPVIAFASGALAEIIEHGKTGFLVGHGQEMAEAIDAAKFLNPDDCRNAARERFSANRMAQQYIHLYLRLVEDGAGSAMHSPSRQFPIQDLTTQDRRTLCQEELIQNANANTVN